MGRSALVVGGTGPTGPYVLQGLLDRGFDVSIFHRGAHEPADLPEVRHIHGDPHFRDQIETHLGNATFDLVIAAYGRTRLLADVLGGRTGQFIAIGGLPRYRGFYDPESVVPGGPPIPVAECDELVRDAAPDSSAPLRFAGQMVATEDAVFAAIPSATYFIYPYVYGPRNVVPVEWSVIRRVLDGRRQLVLPDGGMAIHSRGAARNLAEFLLLAADKPEVSAGQVFNCADDIQLTLRQWVELVLLAMHADVEIVAVPSEVGPRFQAIYIPNSRHLAPHCLLDTRKAQRVLGYVDVVAPPEAVADSVAWYLAHPVNNAQSPAFVDTFDYPLEDALISAWRRTVAGLLTEIPQASGDEVHPMPHPKQSGQLVDQRQR